MIHIRPFQSSDLDSIVKIEKKAFPLPWSARSFLDCARWKEFWFYVAIWDKKVVGYFVAQVVEEEAELHNIAIDPARQKKGFGERLLRFFLDTARQKGVREIFLMVRPSNTAAICLYQKLEFVLIDKRPRYYADTGEEALIFHFTRNRILHEEPDIL